MEQLTELFEDFGEIFSKESERPYSEDYSKEFLNQLK